MNIKIGLVLVSSLCFSFSAVADSRSVEGASQINDGLSQIKGGSYDMNGYLNLMTSDEPEHTKQTSLEIKGGPFDMNGYLNAASEKRPSTMTRNKPDVTANLSMHAQPNLLFVSGS